jgi:hypothetical protein
MKKQACAMLVGMGLAVGMGAAHAEKKKAGLFDFAVPKLPVTRERDAAKQLAPTQLDLTPSAATGEAKTIRLRLYADSDYRGLVLRWQSKARAQVERINAVVAPVFNVRFEIESLRDWNSSHAGVRLEPILDQLEALDPASDVDLVVAFATPLQGVASSIHQIGSSRLLARHFVLRGMDDEQEIRALDREFKLLSPDERLRLYGERKAHKEVVVFLHEWGHVLGLLHNEDKTIIMNPAYDPAQAGFSAFEQKVIGLVVDRRNAHPKELYPETVDLVPLLGAAPRDEGSDQERADLLAFARARAGGGNPNGGKNAGGAVDLSPADVAAFNRALIAANSGKQEEGWGALSPVFAHARAGKVSAATWARLASLAAALGAVSAAEEALTHAPHDAAALKLASELDSTRHRVALPVAGAKVGISPEQEPAYVRGFWSVAESVGSDPAGARAKLDALAAAFPEAAGVDVLSCDLELRLKRAAAGARRCESALAKVSTATRAHYLLGVIAVRGGKAAVAEQHLRRAILLDPTDDAAWRTLAQMYRAERDKKRLTDLANQHQALLSSPLPE